MKLKAVKREKKKKPKMPVFGKSVFTIQEIIIKKAKEVNKKQINLKIRSLHCGRDDISRN